MKIKTSPYWANKPHPKQAAALSLSQIKEIFYGGAAFGGKSDWLLMEASQYADNPKSHSMIFRKTYTDLILQDAILDRAKTWWIPMGIKYNNVERKFTFPSGATVSFGYLQNSDHHLRYQGAAWTMLGFDEASQLRPNQMEYLSSRVRRMLNTDVPLRIRYASNPGDIAHEWLKERFIDAPNTIEHCFVPSKVGDIPSADNEEYTKALKKLDSVTYAQLMHGDWEAQIDSGWMEVDKIKVEENLPDAPEYIRFWDCAATDGDGDYTVGVKAALIDGVYYIYDVRRFRKNPSGVEEEIKLAAEEDGYECIIRMEQEPGSSGKTVINNYSRRILVGYTFRGVPSTGPKTERAKPVASAIGNGNVVMKKAEWNRAFKDELRAFPKGTNDDQVDATSGVFRELNKRNF